MLRKNHINCLLVLLGFNWFIRLESPDQDVEKLAEMVAIMEAFDGHLIPYVAISDRHFIHSHI